MTDINSTLDSEMPEGGSKKRTTFVTVLCILSFIAIGFTIMSNLISIVTYNEDDQRMLEEMMDQSMDELGGSPAAGFLESMFSSSMEAMVYTVELAVTSIIAQLLCLFGCLRIWKMKKNGFYIYLIGEWAPVIISTVLLGFFFGIIGAFAPIIMSILYGMNLKNMD